MRTGQQELLHSATLSSGTSRHGHTQSKSQPCRAAQSDNVNVIILQSASASRLIRVLQAEDILDKEDCDLQLASDSPVVLRKPGIHRQRSQNKKSRHSEVFYSLESNLDQKFPLKLPLTTTISEVQSNLVSSLPSMTSGRFFSANSSVFSGVSSPRSDLSPNKDPEACDDDGDTIHDTGQECLDHIEPIVEVVDRQCDEVSSESLNINLPPEHVKNNSTSVDSEKKNTIAKLHSGKSFIKKSFSVSSRYESESITQICDDNTNLPIEEKKSVRERQSVGGVKFSSVDVDISRQERKYSTLPARQTLAGYKSHKLGLKQLGLHRTDSLNNCPSMGQHLYEEGELSGWSTKDIYDIVSKDLPRMDIVVRSQSTKQKDSKIISGDGCQPGGEEDD